MRGELEDLVRRVDEDRWLASQLAPAEARERLVALYAANYEIARTAEAVREAALGDIRLQFWRDAAAAIYEGKTPPAHPAAEALAVCIRQSGLPREPLDALIDARAKDLESVPFETWADLDAYVDAVSGGLVRLAAIACAPGASFGRAALTAFCAAGRAWGFAGLARAAPYWAARRRTPFPRKLLDHVGLSEADALAGRGGAAWRAAVASLLDRAEAGLKQARLLVSETPSASFPALAYVTLVALYAAAVRRDGGATGLSPIARRFRLFKAALLHRL